MENLQLKELSVQEMGQIEGGVAPLIIGGLILIGILWPEEAK